MANVPLNTDLLNRLLNGLDIETPDDLTTIEAIRAAIRSARDADAVTALEADIMAGNVKAGTIADRVTAAALALVAAERAGELSHKLERRLERRTRDVLVDIGDDIVGQLRPAFDDAAAALLASVEAFGPNPNVDAILKAGPVAAASWEARIAATTKAREVSMVLSMMVGAGYGKPAPFDSAYFMATVPNLDELHRATAAMNSGGPALVNLVAAGFTALQLNTAPEAAKLRAKAATAQSKLDQDRTAAETEARMTPGMRKQAEAWALRGKLAKATVEAAVKAAS